MDDYFEDEEESLKAKPVEETNEEEPAISDEEDDCEGYFLEPTGNNVNIAEKIAEANKKLMEEKEGEEEEEEEEEGNRPRKVQFSENLINFEPIYYSDEDCTESTRNSIIPEENVEIKIKQEEISETFTKDVESLEDLLEEKCSEQKQDDDSEEIVEEFDVSEKLEEIPEEVATDEVNEGNNKLLLVLFPKEQNSSCESIIGEEIGEKKLTQPELIESKTNKVKIARPKSAKKCCEMSKISPNLNYSFEKKSSLNRSPVLKAKNKKEKKENKMFEGEMKVEICERIIKKINIDDVSLESFRRGEILRKCCDRPKSSFQWRKNEIAGNRPKTAPMKRTCCVIKTELPHYNGLRSEYGLTAEQLEERKQRTQQIKNQRKQDKIRERQEELKKRIANEEIFQKWLNNKSKKTQSKKSTKGTDTLTRSDVYIQTHASYAANSSVPYSVDYCLKKKSNCKKSLGKKKKTIIVEKLLSKFSPHLKKSFNIYLGLRP